MATNRTLATGTPRASRHLRLVVCVLLLAIVTAVCFRTTLRWKYRRLHQRSTLIAIETLGRTSLADNAHIRSLLDHFARLTKYSDANSLLPSNTADRIVFYGDSITELWPKVAPEEFFPAPQYLDRGIGGQSTPELLWRFRQDAIGLHPSTVFLLAGTNDILIADRHLTQFETQRNLQAMLDLAAAHRVRVMVCSLPPITSLNPRRQPEFTARVLSLNAWLKEIAHTRHLSYVDYFDSLADSNGAFDPAYTLDGVHPNAAGYHIMHGLAEQALRTRP